MVSNTLYDYLISYEFVVKGAETAQTKVSAAIDKIGSKTAKINQTQDAVTKLSDILGRHGVDEGKIGSILSGMTNHLPAIKLTTQEMSALTASLQKAGVTGGQLTRIQQELGGIGVAAKKTVGNMNDFERAMSRALIVAPVWMAIRSVMQFVGNAIGSNIKFLIELESAMARVKIVGKGTAEEFNKLKTSLLSLATIYGVAATDAVNAAVVFAQQGKTVAETIELTKTAMLGAQVIGIGVKDTVENMTAAMNAFNIPAEQSISIINKWINVEKNFAVTAQNLADATKKAGATANQMGVTLSEFLGDVTAIIEVTRKTGSEAGNALNFIYARVHTTAKNALQNLANISLYMDKFGKATKETQPNLRSATDIIDELALKWSELSDAERIEISTSLGSKRNLVSVSALMQNHTRSIQARVSALTSSLSAETAFNIVQDTTAVKIKQLDSAWKSFGVTFGDSDLFKTGINALRGLIVFTEMFVDKLAATRHAMEDTFESMDRQSKDKMSSTKDLIELLEMQSKLSGAPDTFNNRNIKNQISSAIEDYAKNRPSLKLAIEIGNKDKIIEELNKIRIDAARQLAVTDVNRFYMPRIEVMKSNLTLPEQMAVTAAGDLSKADETKFQTKFDNVYKLIKEYKQYELATQNAINFKYQDYLNKQEEIEKLTIEELNRKGQEIVDELLLTEKQKERLRIDKELNDLSITSGENKVKLLEKEIKLIEESKYQYSGANFEAEKNNQIQQLHLELTKEINNEKEKNISNAIDLLGLTGATTRQLLEAEIAMKSQSFGIESVINDENIRLRLLKEQTKEMLNQVEISNDTVKLYKIAKEHGPNIARGIGSFLTGQISFGQLKEMPRVMDVFKKQFTQQYENLLAAEYFGESFKGSNMRGMGGYIPTAESEAKRRIENIGRESVAQQIQRNISVNGLNINVTVNKEETAGATKEELSKAIFKKMSSSKEFNSVVENILENY